MKVKDLVSVTGWKRALNAARMTVHKNPVDVNPSDRWKAKMLLAEHSPIRLVEYDWTWKDIMQWVTTHLVRHHEGCEKFVATQRGDRHDNGCPRNELPQGAENDMMMTANAQALINISRKRLCACASPETREAWKAVIEQVRKIDPVMADKCVPECIYRGFCPEFDHSCGYYKTDDYKKRLEEYRSIDYDDPHDCEHCQRDCTTDNNDCKYFKRK